MMLKKKVLAGCLAFTIMLSASPLTSFAAERSSNKGNELLTYAQVQKTELQTISESKSKSVGNTSGEFSAQGWKKDALVLALRYGGDFAGDLLSLLSKKNASYVKKYSKELADFLDKVSSDIEEKLVDFMIFDLELPQSAARTIAWAIMQVIG